MKITSLLTTLITENARLQHVYDTYVKPNPKIKTKTGEPAKGIMDFDTLKTIIFGDPTTTVPENFDKDGATFEEMKNVHVGKYVQWMLKNYFKPKLEYEIGTPEYKKAAQEFRRLFLEDMDKMSVHLLKYERFKGKLPDNLKDINKLTPEQLSIAVDDFKLTKDTKSNKEERITKENPFKYPGSNIEIVTPNWTVVKIQDSSDEAKNAAAYFGGYYDTRDEFDETSWCTSKIDSTYFNSYINRGPLYVILPNNATEFGKKTGLPKERYQFHFQDKQFMNRNDRQIDLTNFLTDKASELKDYFRPEFLKNLSSFSDKKPDIIYPDGPIAKYVAIYGFDGIFDYFPDDIISLSFENRSNTEINLDVPPTINRFKDLEFLVFDNFVKKIPDEICDLKKLIVLGLPNNKKLESLPACLSELPELSLIILKDSNPNIKIPNELLTTMSDSFDEMGFNTLYKGYE